MYGYHGGDDGYGFYLFYKEHQYLQLFRNNDNQLKFNCFLIIFSGFYENGFWKKKYVIFCNVLDNGNAATIAMIVWRSVHLSSLLSNALYAQPNFSQIYSDQIVPTECSRSVPVVVR